MLLLFPVIQPQLTLLITVDATDRASLPCKALSGAAHQDGQCYQTPLSLQYFLMKYAVFISKYPARPCTFQHIIPDLSFPSSYDCPCLCPLTHRHKQLKLSMPNWCSVTPSRTASLKPAGTTVEGPELGSGFMRFLG